MEDFLQRWLMDPTVGKGVAAAIGLAIVYTLIKLAQRSIGKYIEDNTTRYRIRKSITFAGYLISVLVVATVFSDRLSGLTVAFGVAGAGIAFALQEVIASAAGWVAISFGNFYAPGDRVQLGGIKGDVIDVGILRTTIMEIGQWVDADLYNGRIVRVANSFVFKEPVFNYSADFPFLWDEIKLPVRYGSDWEYARKVLTAVAREVCDDYATKSKDAWKVAVRNYRLEDARIDPLITLAANDNWIEFTVRYIVDYRQRRSTKDLLFRRFLEEVDKSDNKIRLASATFELTNIPRLDIQFREGKGAVAPTYVP